MAQHLCMILHDAQLNTACIPIHALFFRPLQPSATLFQHHEVSTLQLYFEEPSSIPFQGSDGLRRHIQNQET